MPADSRNIERNGLASADVSVSPADTEVARRRREQVLEAAEAIVAAEGLPRLSLGRIERRTGMSRGQLTYYFPTKEAILLALFERLLRRMIAGLLADDAAPKPGTSRPWDCCRHALTMQLRDRPPQPDFLALLFTFLAEMNHREDFRRRLAAMYTEWRGVIAADVASGVPNPPVRPTVLASVIQALINGLTMQLAVDPVAFDPAEMTETVLFLLAPAFGRPPIPPRSR